MTFRIVVLDDGEEMTSSAMSSKEHALGFARDLRADGLQILRILNQDGDIVFDADEVETWCRSAPPARARSGRLA